MIIGIIQKLHNDQCGTSLLLVIILIASVATAAGFAVARAMQAKQQAAIVALTSMPQPSSTSRPAANWRAYNIPELGVTLSLPAGIYDLEYTADASTGSANGADYPTSSARFTTAAIKAMGAYCSTSGGAIGVITRYPFDPATAGITGIGRVRQVGSNYYAYSHPQSTCGEDEVTNAAQKTQSDLLMETFGTIKAD